MRETRFHYQGAHNVLQREQCYRKTGIDIIGEVPWGTHFCMFYKSKYDLLEILIPFFRAGLENGEFCMWITSKPLTKSAAIKAIRRAVPGFNDYISRGQIEILAFDEWYVKNGSFESERVLNGWVEKYNEAREKGYSGLRLTGNTFWLEKEDWQNFMHYEDSINDIIGNYRMLALCTYSMDRCGAAEIMDVAQSHQFVLANRDNHWTMIENAEIKQTKEALNRNNQKLEILSDSASLLLKSNSPQSVMDELCRKVMDFLDCQVFFNYLVDEERSGMHLNAWAGISEQTAKGMEWLESGQSVCGCAAREARPIVANNIPEIPDPRTELVKSFGVKAYACYPLIAEERVIGTLSFGTATRSIFSGDDLAMMKTMADMVAVAMMRINTETYLRLSEERLRQASREWEDTFNSISDPISIHDEEFRIVKANRAFEKVVGMESNEFIGKKCHEVIHKSETPWLNCPHKQCISCGKPVTREFLEQGLGKYLLVSCSPISDYRNQLNGTVHVIKDVTERNRHLEELKIRTAELEATNSDLESFSYTVSHDLRAPLRAIEGFSSMLVGEINGKLDQEAIRKFNVIRSNAGKMSHLIDDLLSYSRTGRAKTSITKIDILSLVQEIWKDLQEGNPGRKMELVIGGIPPAAGDRMLIRQALSNLLGNSVKFSRKRERALIEVGGVSSGRFNTYCIKDNGAGFDMNYSGRLFEIFRRLHKESEFEGTGIGLAIVKKIIEKHGGAIWAEGKPGEGATFCFTLPAFGN